MADLQNGLMNPENYDMAQIVEELEQYYEAAGFSGYYDKKLSTMSDNELVEHFADTFGVEMLSDLERR